MMLEAKSLTFAYPNCEPILNSWSAKFEAGSTTAIVGQSGRGKSTLLYLLGLMLQPSKGYIYLNDICITGGRDAELAGLRARFFGFVFQDAALDPTRSIMDNILESSLYRGEGKGQHRAKALELLRKFGVSVDVNSKPGQVSGGQAQRIALCRALLHNPKILLADEPTGNLDPESTEIVVQALSDYAKQANAVVVIVTHSMDIAARCDKTVRL